MIKKVVISAAGQGTRMLELTNDKSKHLIEVEKRPFLSYLLDNILEAGYMEIILVVGFREDMIREFLKGYKFNGKNVDIKIVNQFDMLGPKEKEYGTACPIRCVKDMVGQENFISLCGDNFYSVEDLKLININDKYNYVAGLKSETPEKFGVLIKDGEFLKKIIEKPSPSQIYEINLGGQENFVSNLINTSLYKFTKDVFEKLPLIEKSPRGEYEITDVISLLAEDKKVKVKIIKDDWMDFGTPSDIEKFSKLLKNKSK